MANCHARFPHPCPLPLAGEGDKESLSDNSRMQWFFRQFARLPLAWLHALGVATGWLIYWSSSPYAARMRENIAHSGLCESPESCQRLLRQAIGEAGKSVLELPAVWLRPYEKVLQLVREVEGWEQV